MTSRMPTRPSAPRARHPILAAVGLFAVACGLLLLLLPLRDHSDEPIEAPAAEAETAPAPNTAARDRVLTGLEHTRTAQRAIADGNYRSAREHIAVAEQALTELLAEAGSPQLATSEGGRIDNGQDQQR